MNILSLRELIETAGDVEEARKILASFSISRTPDVEHFLHDRIFQYEKTHEARSYFALDSSGKILGFYSLAITTFQIKKSTPPELAERLVSTSNPLRKFIPGILIGQIARFDDIPKNELPGAILMEDALDRIGEIHKQIGLRFICLDCADSPKLKEFYESFGFCEANKDDRFCRMIAFFKDNPLT